MNRAACEPGTQPPPEFRPDLPKGGTSALGDEYNVIFTFPFGMLYVFKVVHESLIAA